MNPRGPRIPWLALCAVGVFVCIALAVPLVRHGYLHVPPCPLKLLTGIPCATCGITRCLLALWQKDLRTAFHWHPVATLVILLLPLAALWDLLRAWRSKPYPSLPDSLVARLSVAGLLLVTWLLQIVRGV